MSMIDGSPLAVYSIREVCVQRISYAQRWDEWGCVHDHVDNLPSKENFWRII